MRHLLRRFQIVERLRWPRILNRLWDHCPRCYQHRLQAYAYWLSDPIPQPREPQDEPQEVQ